MRSSKEMTLRRFYSNLALHYEDCTYYLHPVGIKRREKVIRLLVPLRNDRVCDLGCGDGNLAIGLVSRTKQIVGIDIAHARLRRATTKGILGLCADITHLPFVDGYFDKVICSEVLEHLVSPRDALLEIRRLLKPNGIAVVTVPVGQIINKSLLDVSDEDLEQLDYIQIKSKYGIMDSHLNTFSEESFITLLRDNRFGIDALDYVYDYEIRNKICSILLRLNWHIQRRINGNRVDKIYRKVFAKWMSLLYRKMKTKHHLVVKIRK